MLLIRNTCILAVILARSVMGIAQDSHYWTNQFGTRSALLSGAVLAGYKDNSMVFYNPGAIGLIDSSSVSLNASLYQIERYNLETGDGDMLVENGGTELGNIPLTLTGLINQNLDNRITVGYGIGSSLRFDFGVDGRFDNFLNVVNDQISPGDEELISQYSVNARVNETQYTIAGGYRLKENLGIGLTLSLTDRNQKYARFTNSTAILNPATANPDLASLGLQSFVKYFQIRLNSTLGISHITDLYSWGFTLTTPALTLYSSARVSGDYKGIDMVDESGERVSFVANDAQKDLVARYKMPVAIGAGFSRLWPRFSFNISAEFFTGIPVYELISVEDANFLRPSDVFDEIGSKDFLTVYEGARPVFNAAVGVDYDVSDFVRITIGFRTNFTYFNPEIYQLDVIGIQPQITTWDIFYNTIGFTLRNERNDLTFGLQTGLGNDNRSRILGNEPAIGDVLDVLNNDQKASYLSFGLILGYNYIFRSRSD